VRNPEEYSSVLELVARDLNDSGILGIVSDDIKRDALQKFSFVSPMAACGLYYNVEAGKIQQEGKERKVFIKLIQELEMLANAMNIHFKVDIIENNLEILKNLATAASTSMQRDIQQGKKSEIDGLIFQVVRLSRRYGVNLPTYEMIWEAFGFE
jgi:2-dehydropantoate 2-reductase